MFSFSFLSLFLSLSLSRLLVPGIRYYCWYRRAKVGFGSEPKPTMNLRLAHGMAASQSYLVVCHLCALPPPAPSSWPTLDGSKLAVHSLKDDCGYGRVIISRAMTSRSEVCLGWMPFPSSFLLASISLLSFLTSPTTFPCSLLSRLFLA